MAERQRPSPHTTHDLELIAGWSTGDLDAHERSRAIGLIDACHDCAALAADLRAITATMTTLRSGSDVLHRDFRLSAADAERLQHGSGLRRWLGPLAGSAFGFARPVGSLVTAVALVGLLVSSVPGGLYLGAASDASMELATNGRNLASETQPASAPNASPAAMFDGASPSSKGNESATGAPTGAPTVAPTHSRLSDEPLVSGGGSTSRPLLIPSLLLLAAGLLLLVGPRFIRRLVGAAREP